MSIRSREDAGRLGTVLLSALALLSAPAGAQEVDRGGELDPARADSGAGTVTGQVSSAHGGGPVAGAAVRIWIGDERYRTVLTDSAGRYRVANVPSGRWPLRISSLDHASFYAAVQISGGDAVELDVELDVRPVVVPALDAIAGTLDLIIPPGDVRSIDDGSPRGTRADPGLRALDVGTGTAGMARALEGVRERTSPDPSSVLYARGGASDLKRVMLDGAPVYAPFHLGGLMPALPRGAIGSAELYTGGAPVSYDGGLSYVLDLRTRPGGDGPLSAGGHADLLGASLRTDGSAGDVAWNVSGRRTQDVTSGWLLDGNLPYGYGELLGRFDVTPSPDHRIAVTGFTNRETIDLAEAAPGDDGASWGNRAVSLRYGTDLGSTRGVVTAAASSFDTRLPVSEASEENGRSNTDRLRLAVDLGTQVGETDLAYGAAVNRHATDLVLPPSGDEASERRWRGRTTVGAGYGAATVRPGDDVELRGGLRATLGPDRASPHVAPRLSLTWKAAPSTDLRLATGGFHQVMESPESALSADLDEWNEVLRQRAATTSTASLGDLASASASHVTVGMDHRPRDDMEMGFEGYFKTFDGLGESGGDLRTSGADLWLDFAHDDWAAWAGYSLAWAWADRPLEDEGRNFSGRQLLSAGVEVPLPSRLRLDARMRVSSGLPFNRIPLVGQETANAGDSPEETPTEATPEPLLAGTPDGSYVRLDLTLSKHFRSGLLGREADYRAYVRFLNALDRRDALFYQVDPSSQMRPRALDSFPVLPVVGLEWSVP